MKKTLAALSLALAVCLMLAACRSKPALTNIFADENTQNIELETGESINVELKAEFNKEDLSAEQIDAAFEKAELSWQSSNEDIAVVKAGKNGRATITALAAGKAEIKAFSAAGAELEAVFNITVQEPVVALETLSVEEEISLEINGDDFGTYKLNAEYSPLNADDVTLSFESSDSSVAVVDNDGTVTAVGKGSAVITTTAKGLDEKGEEKTLAAQTEVAVKILATEIELSSYEGWIYTGGTYTIEAQLLPLEAEEDILVFSSSDESVAVVDEDGKITGKKAGTAVITVSCKQAPKLEAQYSISVKNRSVSTGTSSGAGAAADTGSAGSAGTAPATGGDSGGNAAPVQPENEEIWPDNVDSPYDPLEPGDPTHGGDVGGD